MQHEPLMQHRWTQAWNALGMAGDDAWRDRLLASYADTTRHYHTLQHLAECLDLFDTVAHLAVHPGEVAIALWFHDAVYVPLAADNEARSAAWAGTALLAAGAGQSVIDRVEALVMATAHHHGGTGDADTDLVVDIDLAILGAPPVRFAQYERQVRAEYSAVPAIIYQHKRRALLARFLARPEIYATPALRERCEQQARCNLRRVLGLA